VVTTGDGALDTVPVSLPMAMLPLVWVPEWVVLAFAPVAMSPAPRATLAAPVAVLSAPLAVLEAPMAVP
jgi:hypothetical protein